MLLTVYLKRHPSQFVEPQLVNFAKHSGVIDLSRSRRLHRRKRGAVLLQEVDEFGTRLSASDGMR